MNLPLNSQQPSSAPDDDDDSPSQLIRHSPLSPSQSPSDSSLSESELQNLLQRYPFAAEPSYFTRPNRYHGPASTWRSWTADDRAISDALDYERAADLSVHLFNAFALKQKAQGFVFDGRKSIAVTRSRSREVEPSAAAVHGENDSQPSFIPPRLWTAWPLRGWEVPRRNECESHRGANYQHKLTRHSTSLEEALIATSLRCAKETWKTRSSEAIPLQMSRKKRDWKAERDLTTQQLIDSGVIKSSASPDLQLDLPEAIGTPAATEDIVDEDLDIEPPEGIQTFSSQAFLAESSSSESENISSETENCDHEPVFSADDAEARRTLLPSTRHILSKLDDLLIGLHKARKAYAVRDLREQASLSRSQSRPHTQSAGNGSNTDTNADIVHKQARAEEKVEKYTRTGTPRTRDRERRRERERERGRKRQRSPQLRSPPSQTYGLRDWSDIIGMATLTGWKTETVARAAERCARLFDENMMFRTFHDPMASPSAPTLSANTMTKPKEVEMYDEEFAYVPTPPLGTDEQDYTLMNAGRLIDITSTPGVRYIRSSSPCFRCRMKRLRCVPSPTLHTHTVSHTHAHPNPASEPLKPPPIIDETTHVPCAACAAFATRSPGAAPTCSGIRVKIAPTTPQSPPKPRICPHLSCFRHTRPFKTQYHLERHLRSVHSGTDRNSDTMAELGLSQSSPVRNAAMEEAKVGMDLVCPVPTCPRHLHKYSRPTRLYAHVRSEHPEIDFFRFRALMGQRGESMRGKYDRSKTRSGSRSDGGRDVSEEGVDDGYGDGDGGDNGEMIEDEEDENESEHHDTGGTESRGNDDDDEVMSDAEATSAGKVMYHVSESEGDRDDNDDLSDFG